MIFCRFFHDPRSGLAGVLFGQSYAFIVAHQCDTAFKFPEKLAAISNFCAAFWARNSQAFRA